MRAFKIFLTTFLNLVLFSLLNGVGELKVWYGPMLSGKSEAILDYAKDAIQQGKNVLAVKPTKAIRDGARIVSYCPEGKEIDAVFLNDTEEGFDAAEAQLFDTIKTQKITEVIFDEFQFFPLKAINFVFQLLDIEINVGIATLDLNFLGQRFGTTFSLIERALPELGNKFQGHKLTAICEECKRSGRLGVSAQYSQRIVDGIPVITGDVVGIKDVYEPRCVDCFICSN